MLLGFINKTVAAGMQIYTEVVLLNNLQIIMLFFLLEYLWSILQSTSVKVLYMSLEYNFAYDPVAVCRGEIWYMALYQNGGVCPRAYKTTRSAYIASLVRSRCQGHPGAKHKLAHCPAEVACHETVEDRVDGRIRVAEQQGVREQLYVLVNSQVEEQSQHIVRQPAEGKQHSEQQQDTGHSSPLSDKSGALWTSKT